MHPRLEPVSCPVGRDRWSPAIQETNEGGHRSLDGAGRQRKRGRTTVASLLPRSIRPRRDSFRRATFVLALALAILVWSTGVVAQTVKECIFAAERGQVTRDQGELEQARTYFQTCARDSCPELIRSDCSGWLQALPVEPAQVNLTVTAADASHQLSPRVFLNGDQTDAAQLSVPPGDHEIKVTAPGYLPYERSLKVAAGQTVALDVTLVPVSASTSQSEAGESGADGEGGGIPTASWVLGGVAVAGGAMFAGFGLAARNQFDELQNECGGQCPAEQVEAVDRKQLIANVSAGVGLGALIGAIWVAIADAERPQRSSTGLLKRKLVSSRSGLVLQVRSDIRANRAGLSLSGAF